MRVRSVANDALTLWCHGAVGSTGARSAYDILRHHLLAFVPPATDRDAIWWRLCDAFMVRGVLGAALECISRVRVADAARAATSWRKLCDVILAGGVEGEVSQLIHVAEATLVPEFAEQMCMSLIVNRRVSWPPALVHLTAQASARGLTLCSPGGRAAVHWQECVCSLACGRVEAAAQALERVHELGGVVEGSVAADVCTHLLASGQLSRAAAVAVCVHPGCCVALDRVCNKIGKALMKAGKFGEVLRLHAHVLEAALRETR